MDKRVRVTVNGKTEEWHLGLKVKHAIGARWARKVRARRALVRDAEATAMTSTARSSTGST